MSSELDQVDLRLIVELQKNVRNSNAELARLMNVSESTVRRRINRLVSSGTIMLTAVPDPIKMGYQTLAFIGLQVKLSQIEAVAKRLIPYPEVHYIGICSGSSDIIIR